MKDCNPRIVCKDGVSLSVQGSQYTYCAPRDDEGPYYQVEVGFIKNADKKQLTPPTSWEEYSDGEFPSDIYSYIPVELVEAFITEHGGAVSGQMP